MNDDKLLEGIARAARDEAAADPLDPRWDALAAGELSDEARHALREACDDPKLAERAETAFEPLDDAFRAQLAAAAVAAAGGGSDAPAAQGGTAEPADSNVVPLRRHPLRSPWALGLAASALLAIGVVLTGDLLGPRGGPIPGYTYDLRGTAGMRSGDAPQVQVRADETLTLTLTPATALDAPARVGLFVDDGTRWVPVAGARADIADSGAARITAPAAGLGPGEVTLVAIVARGDFPERGAALDDTWRAVTIPLIVVP